MACRKEARGTKPRSAMGAGSVVLWADTGGGVVLEVPSVVLWSLARAGGAFAVVAVVVEVV